jgi:hypothetical protein
MCGIAANTEQAQKDFRLSKLYRKQMRRTKNLKPTPVDRRAIKVLLQMTPVIVLAARLR